MNSPRLTCSRVYGGSISIIGFREHGQGYPLKGDKPLHWHRVLPPPESQIRNIEDAPKGAPEVAPNSKQKVGHDR